ncbi:MAG: hypothetical protein CMJ25_07835 [Phycisphaerae bacterium]|nr:hypothetical protein [Phycisphaerae bacterium]|tara:strand:- start:4593 stop:5363 length:771 start_codon:yes stop_codon:yes gene_type:complete
MPLYSDVLQNTNSNAPCLNITDLQVNGFGIFADTAARDALNATIRTEGYLACMNDSDKVYIYTSSSIADVDWTNTANWQLTGVDTLIGLTDTPAGYGTSGQVLTTNGTDAAAWEDAPSPVGVDLALNTRTNAYSVAGDHEGTVLSIGTLGLTVGTVYMWDGSGEWADANAGAVATADGLMGVSTATATAPDVLVSGIIQLASVPGSAGDVLYLDTTNGLLTATAPSGSTEIVRVMGHNLGGNRIYFNPSQDWLEIV